MNVPEAIIGFILIILSSFGSVANLISFSYFVTAKTKNSNNAFFKALYLVISLNDVFFCLLVIPEIEALFSHQRLGDLFLNNSFCAVWFVLHSTSYHIAITLLGVLSLTRLMLIRNPTVVFRPITAFLSAGLIGGGFALLYGVSMGLNLIHTYYSPILIQCTFQSMEMDNTTRLYTPRDQNFQRFYSFVQYGIAVLCFFIVCISVIATLYYLRKSGKAAENIQGSQRHQREAGITVVLMTLLYIIFNFLTFLMYVFIMLNWMLFNPVELGVATVNDVMIRMREDIFSGVDVLNEYAPFLVTTFAACLNSAFNPVLYYFRLKAFREFVHTHLHATMDRVQCFGKRLVDFHHSKDSLEGKTCPATVDTRVILDEP